MNLRSWVKAAGIRAAKTFAQVAVAGLTLGEPTTGILDVSWTGVASVAALAAVVSLLMSVAGLPEVPDSDSSTQRGTHYRSTM